MIIGSQSPACPPAEWEEVRRRARGAGWRAERQRVVGGFSPSVSPIALVGIIGRRLRTTPCLGAELSAEVIAELGKTAAQGGLDRSQRRPDLFRDFAECKSLQVCTFNDRSLEFRKRRNALADAVVSLLENMTALRSLALIRPGFLPVVIKLRRRGIRDVPSKAVNQMSTTDQHHPGHELGAGGVISVRRPPESDEDLLDRVVGLRSARQKLAGALEDQRSESVIELLDRAAIPVGDALHQREIGRAGLRALRRSELRPASAAESGLGVSQRSFAARWNRGHGSDAAARLWAASSARIDRRISGDGHFGRKNFDDLVRVARNPGNVTAVRACEAVAANGPGQEFWLRTTSRWVTRSATSPMSRRVLRRAARFVSGEMVSAGARFGASRVPSGDARNPSVGTLFGHSTRVVSGGSVVGLFE